MEEIKLEGMFVRKGEVEELERTSAAQLRTILNRIYETKNDPAIHTIAVSEFFIAKMGCYFAFCESTGEKKLEEMIELTLPLIITAIRSTAKELLSNIHTLQPQKGADS
jgi:hypothetical protein